MTIHPIVVETLQGSYRRSIERTQREMKPVNRRLMSHIAKETEPRFMMLLNVY